MSDLMTEVMSGFQSNKLTKEEATAAKITAGCNYMLVLEKAFKRNDGAFTKEEENELDKYYSEFKYFKDLYPDSTTTKE